MKKIFKETLLYFLVGIASIFSIVFLGIVGLPNTAGGKIILWLFAGLLSYSSYVFIPFFKKSDSLFKRDKSIDYTEISRE
jgi:cytochrome c biogenesis protein CcdA